MRFFKMSSVLKPGVLQVLILRVVDEHLEGTLICDCFCDLEKLLKLWCALKLVRWVLLYLGDVTFLCLYICSWRHIIGMNFVSIFFFSLKMFFLMCFLFIFFFFWRNKTICFTDDSKISHTWCGFVTIFWFSYWWLRVMETLEVWVMSNYVTQRDTLSKTWHSIVGKTRQIVFLYVTKMHMFLWKQ